MEGDQALFLEALGNVASRLEDATSAIRAGHVELRDHFAAAALHGLRSDGTIRTPAGIAGEAYRLADAMLVAREGEPPKPVDDLVAAARQAIADHEHGRHIVFSKTIDALRAALDRFGAPS